MSAARSFRSVFMVASCAGAALGCYLVSLRVASERAALEEVENRIVLAQRDIRLLQTEIGTRGRLAQLERWNVKVLALSAPSADQFLEGGFQLARLAAPQEKLNVEAPVVLASAPAPQPTSPQLVPEQAEESGAGANSTAARLMRQASLKVPVREDVPAIVERPAKPLPQAIAKPSAPKPILKKDPAPTVAKKAADPKPAAKDKKAETKVATAAKPAIQKAGDKKGATVSKAVTEPVSTAKVDPLAPLPAKVALKKTARDSGTPR